MKARINIPGLIAGILLLLGIMLFSRLWVLKAGENLLSLTVSLTGINLVIMGKEASIPIVKYLSISILLFSTLTAVMLITGSILASKKIGLSILRAISLNPLIFTIIFTVIILITPYIIVNYLSSLLGLKTPIQFLGESTANMTLTTRGIELKLSIPIKGELQQGYYILWITSITALISRIIKAK